MCRVSAAPDNLSRSFWLVAIACWLWLTLLFNLWPGLLPAPSATMIDLGLADCFARQPIGRATCDAMGYPTPYPVAFGLPLLLIKGLAVRWLPLDTAHAALLVDAGVLAIALAGMWLLLRQLGAGIWLALFGGYLFLSAPIVQGQDGYGSLRYSFALVPLYVWLDLHLRARLEAPHRRWLAAAAIASGVLLMRVAALFMDGYGFVMALLLTGGLFVPWAWTRWQARDTTAVIAGASVLALSTLAAYVTYTAYFPGAGDFVTMTPAYFRGQGVDLYALAVPSWRFLMAEATGVVQSISAWQAYTDGPPLTDVYLGASTLAAFALGLRVCVRSSQPRRHLQMAVLAVGAIALLLATGPELKIADFREAGTTDLSQLQLTYEMPEGAGTLDLGTMWIYQHVPGIKTMRALYRWHLLVRVALVAGAMLGLDWLWRRQRWSSRALAVTLAALMMVELLPNLPRILEAGRGSWGMMQVVDHTVVEPLRVATAHGERVLLEPCLTSAPHNDYLASYICGRADVRCYNAAGDKSFAAVAPGWSQPVHMIMGNHYDRLWLDLDQVFSEGALDAVVFTRFGLWEDAQLAAARHKRGDGCAFAVRFRRGRRGMFALSRRSALGYSAFGGGSFGGVPGANLLARLVEVERAEGPEDEEDGHE